LLISRLAIDKTWCWRLQKQLSRTEPRRKTHVESQEIFRKEVNAEEKFKKDSAAYLQRLINERKKQSQN
jgi:hypothetical protein